MSAPPTLIQPKNIALERDGRIHVSDRTLPVSDPTKKFNWNNNTLSTAKRDFFFPEYNFSELRSIEETEPFVARAYERKLILCLKEGFDIVGKNEAVVKYIKKRLEEIHLASGISFKQFIKILLHDVIRYSNCFFVKVRDQKRSSGKPRKIGNKTLQPLAALFHVPIQTVTFRYTPSGIVDAIRQEMNAFKYWYGGAAWSNENPIFTKENFLHARLWHEAGHTVAMPILIGVKEDVVSLRRIEENAELLIYQYLFPLYHYKIGTAEAPVEQYPDGTTEIDRYANTIASLPSEGAHVTSWRHEIEVLGAQKDAIDPLPFLEWFKKRVFAGLAASALDYGEGDTANRSTSDNLSQLIIDYCKHVQQVVSQFVEEELFAELIAESTFAEQDSEDLKVELQFREIDVSEQIKRENHAVQMFTQSGITHSELRYRIGMDPIPDLATNEELFFNMNKLREESAAKAAGENKDQPSNQHGKNLAPTKRKSSYLADALNPRTEPVGIFTTAWQEVLSYASLYTSQGLHSDHIDKVAGVVLSAVESRFLDHLGTSFVAGWAHAETENALSPRSAALSRIDQLEIKEWVESLMSGLLDTISSRLKSAPREEWVARLESLTWRAELIDRVESVRAYQYGVYSRLSEEEGVLELWKHPKDGTPIFRQNLDKSLSWTRMPPYEHPNSEEHIRLRKA